MTSRGQRVAGRAALALAALALSLAVLEAVCRIYLRHRETATTEGLPLPPHPTVLWQLPPASFVGTGNARARVNSLGMRGPELVNPRPANSVRILFVGDSSVYGFGVTAKDAFAYLAAHLTGELLGRPCEPANAAVPGYSSAQCRRLLPERLKQTQPDIVVIAALWSDMMRLPWTDAELFAKLDPATAAQSSSPLAHSALCRLLQPQRSATAGIDRRLVLSTIWTHDPDAPGNLKPRVSAAEHRQNLEQMVARVHAHGAAVCLLILPDKADLADDRSHGPPADAYRANYRALAEQQDLTLVDMATRFQALDRADPDALFFDDVHPGIEGHRLIAQHLAEALATLAASRVPARPADSGE